MKRERSPKKEAEEHSAQVSVYCEVSGWGQEFDSKIWRHPRKGIRQDTQRHVHHNYHTYQAAHNAGCTEPGEKHKVSFTVLDQVTGEVGTYRRKIKRD